MYQSSSGLWLPDKEAHFEHYGERLAQYQQRTRDAAYAYVKHFRRAIDLGANVGIFSVCFAKRFAEVISFEPVPTTAECLRQNTLDYPNVRIEQVAIAEKAGTLQMYRTGSSGGSFISNHPSIRVPELKTVRAERVVDVEVRTLDSYNFDDVDLIKLDIQGAEILALEGGKQTILRNRPVVVIEEKHVAGDDSHIPVQTDLLLSWGMVRKERVESDRIFVFE